MKSVTELEAENALLKRIVNGLLATADGASRGTMDVDCFCPRCEHGFTRFDVDLPDESVRIPSEIGHALTALNERTGHYEFLLREYA